MKNSLQALFAALLLSGLIILANCGPESPKLVTAVMPTTTNGLPQDVMPICTLSQAQFNSWFLDGKATENGVVQPANSVLFPHNNNCDFYQWSHQMFLWMTSSLSGSTVMETPMFYTVSPENAQKQRFLTKNDQGMPLRASALLMKNEEGELVDTEEGQATADGLIAQTGSLVYYITMVNDVYAFYLLGAKTGQISGGAFPTTASTRDSICRIARNMGMVLPDSNALAIEIKTSWVEAATLPNASSYVTVKAIIPTYTKTNSTWTPSGETTTTLALVGIHIVGSVAGHPEMIWSTFEHNKNTPNAAYSYLASNGSVKNVPQDGGTGWLFTNNPADSKPNQSHMTVAGQTITAKQNQTISASNTQRILAWGVQPGIQPNQQDTSASASNSEVIGINNSINSMLVGNDIRKNYNQIGATWTFGGTPPNGKCYSASNTTPGVSIGTSQLANSTMETYAQFDAFGQVSCFSCHNKNNNLEPASLSHVYGDIVPPFTPANTKK